MLAYLRCCVLIRSLCTESNGTTVGTWKSLVASGSSSAMCLPVVALMHWAAKEISGSLSLGKIHVLCALSSHVGQAVYVTGSCPSQYLQYGTEILSQLLICICRLHRCKCLPKFEVSI